MHYVARFRRRLRKTNTCPQNGSSPITCRVATARPSKLFRRSTGWAHRYTRTVDGKLSTQAP